ncbi:MAG: glycoside hydrolase 100 family protein [Bryobacteraceae bacterium]
MNASGGLIGHRQVWARDAMIASLGARLAEDEEIQLAIRKSISLLREKSTPSGQIPNNVDTETLQPNYRAYADGGLWWIIGSARLAPDPEMVRGILGWYECQDVDRSGLLSMQESADWQDLFCTRGKGLYLNCLYVLALRSAARLFAASDPAQSKRCSDRADNVVEMINGWLWYSGDADMLRYISHSFSTIHNRNLDSLGRKRWVPEKRHLIEEQYYLPYLGFRAVGEWFDSLGNLLAILAGVASPRQADIIFDFVSHHCLHTWPIRSLTPAVRPGDSDWRDYYGSLNTPHCYHNGGIWPFIGGFYVAALVHAGRGRDAAVALRNLAELNSRGGFNEWHHGETGEPMGARDQAWSAGMYLFAHDCVQRGRVDFF